MKQDIGKLRKALEEGEQRAGRLRNLGKRRWK